MITNKHCNFQIKMQKKGRNSKRNGNVVMTFCTTLVELTIKSECPNKLHSKDRWSKV